MAGVKDTITPALRSIEICAAKKASMMLAVFVTCLAPGARVSLVNYQCFLNYTFAVSTIMSTRRADRHKPSATAVSSWVGINQNIHESICRRNKTLKVSPNTAPQETLVAANSNRQGRDPHEEQAIPAVHNKGVTSRRGVNYSCLVTYVYAVRHHAAQQPPPYNSS